MVVWHLPNALVPVRQLLAVLLLLAFQVMVRLKGGSGEFKCSLNGHDRYGGAALRLAQECLQVGQLVALHKVFGGHHLLREVMNNHIPWCYITILILKWR